MAKKDKNLEEDMLTGGSIKSGNDKPAKSGKKGKGLAPNVIKGIKAAVCVVVVVALLVTYVATGAVRKGFVASLSLPAHTLTGVTVTNGTEKAKIKVSTYNYYFASTYNNLQSQQSQYKQYGLDLEQIGLDVDFDKPLSSQTYTDSTTKETMTWAEHLDKLVLDSIEQTYTYYLAAVAANDGKEPEITEEQQKELNEDISSIRETANKYGYTLSGYLVRAMGRGVTESVMRTETIRQYIANNYQQSLSDEITEKKYSADEVAKYKDEHLEDFKTVDIKLFECDSEDNAKAFAKELKADGSNFSALAVKYSKSDFDKKAYADDTYSTITGATRDVLINRGYAIATHDHEEGETHKEGEEEKYPGLDWLFSKDRKAGDVKQYSTTVVYVISPASITNTNTVNVRHILIAPDTGDEDTSATEATAKQWQAAYKEATALLNKWKNGKATEATFKALVADNTADTGSTSTGGLYDNVVTGQMVDSFSNWCFDSSRKAGDTTIVMSQFGYHIMYFCGTNDEKVWQVNAEAALKESDNKSASDKLEDEYTLKVNWFGSRYFEKDVDIDN